MTSSPDTPPQGQRRLDWLELLTRNHKASAYGLFVIAAGLLLIPVLFSVYYKTEYIWVSVWGGLLTLIALVAGMWQLMREPRGLPSDLDETRMMVLTVGGLAGLVTVLLVPFLTYQWWTEYLAGGLEVWRKHPLRLGTILLALFGGLALMFVSLQLARSEERQSVVRRRLVYGYNAFLTGLMLLAILALLNVLSYVKMPPFSLLGETYDWTESRLYSVSDASKNVLKSLDKPLKVYIFANIRRFYEFEELKTLFNNFQQYTDKMEVQFLSPDADYATIDKLTKKFTVPEQRGILLVYGTEGSEQDEFVRWDDLFEAPFAPGPDSKPRFVLKGENAIISKLAYLQEGKAKSIVYFTQGNGEPDLNSFEAQRGDQGLAALRDRLQKNNYEVKELTLGTGTDKVPDNATVVVIVKPLRPFAEPALKALHNYLSPPDGDAKKKGRLMVLLEPLITRDGTMTPTGLEDLLSEHNVLVGNDLVVGLRNRRNATEVMAVSPAVFPNYRGNNPIARTFGDAFTLEGVRTVRPKQQAGPPGMPQASRFTVEPLLVAPFLPAAGIAFWAETNLKANPNDLVADLTKPGRGEALNARVSREHLPVAVTVSEPQAPAGGADPHDFMRRPSGDQVPRMVVFGDATWATNRAIQDEREGELNYALFSSSLAWLRERPTIGRQAEDKERQFYAPKIQDDVVWRLWLLPVTLMVIVIIGLGMGIWIVRRR